MTPKPSLPIPAAMVVEQRQPARKKVVNTKTGLIFAIMVNCSQKVALVILFSLPKVRKFSVEALAIVMKEQEREAMATHVLKSSLELQMRAKKMMAIWKADSNCASLQNLVKGVDFVIL